MMKRTLNTTVSALALLLALNTPVSASYSDEEDSSKGRYSVGKEDEWDRQSMASRAFSDRRGPAPKKPSKEEGLSYNPEDEWEVGSQYTYRSQGRGNENQKLTEIKELRRYMNKGSVEITPPTYKDLLKYANFYSSSFHAFDKGVAIKGWKASVGFDPLLDLLQSFSNIKSFKLGVEWDKENDVTELLTRTLQFYENLSELDIANCRLTDEGMNEIMEAIQNPPALKLLDIRNNKLSPQTFKHIKEHFKNLVTLKSEQDVESIPLAPLTLAPQKPRPEPTGLSVNTKAPSKLSFPMPPADPEEQKLPSDVLKKAKAGNAEAQYDIGEKYYKGEGVAQNYAKAMDTYHKAAHQNHVPSQARLREIYNAKQGIFNNPIAAFQDYQERTRTGDRMAEIILGWMYKDGFGTEKDDKQGIAIFQKNADQGYAAAQFNLGGMYQCGLGVAKDEREAVAWYRKAAEQGYATAQKNLGGMYQYGRGVAKDEREAVAWYRKAADQGYAAAQSSLGWMYENGQGVAKDDAMAVQWYRKAADQGNAIAQFNLGWMYENGRGVAKE